MNDVSAAHHTLRKAAVLVASLDRQTADALLEQMDAAQAQAIRDAIMELPVIERAEELGAIREFMGSESVATSAGLAPSSQRQGEPSPLDGHPAMTAHEDAACPALESASERLIAECLCAELPQTIAVALSQLSTQRASEVVAHLPAAVQTQVLERLVDDTPAASGAAADVRELFQQWLSQQIGHSLHRADLAARLAAILGATHSGTRERILENVAHNDASLASELRNRLAHSTCSGERLGDGF
jgi:flagellar motor switch protein FliG